MDKAELDHIFLFVRDEDTARSMMDSAKLRVNYERVNPGQGTRNLCACLDDIFLELLWLDGTPVSEETERISLARRGRGDGSPIGISWRGPSPYERNGEIEAYHAPFLPSGVSIPVARASLDPALPFVFRSPGGTAPIARTGCLVGTRQAPELSTLGSCTVRSPDPQPMSEFLSPFEQISV